MSNTYESDLKKELRVLLNLIASKPSADMSRERARVVVLNDLLARWSKQAA